MAYITSGLIGKSIMKEVTKPTRAKLQLGLFLVKRVDIWYAERCTGGRRTRRSLDTSDLQEAADKALAAGPEVTATPGAFLKNAPKVLTPDKALAKYEDWYVNWKHLSCSRHAVAGPAYMEPSVLAACNLS